jgi:hypothetical protein
MAASPAAKTSACHTAAILAIILISYFMVLLLTARVRAALTAGTVLLAARLLAVLGLILPAHLHSRRPRRARRACDAAPRPAGRQLTPYYQ